MNILESVSLKNYTSLKLGGNASHFAEVNSEDQIPHLLEWANAFQKKTLVMGGGSNLVISNKDYEGLVLKINIDYLKTKSLESEYVLLEVGAGMNWDKFVEFTVENGFWGVENMSLIPGMVGAVPVQNVGAYGQDASGVVESVRVFDTVDKIFKSMTNEQCNFTWRHSVFNTSSKGRFIITNVVFRLSLIPVPNLTRVDLHNHVFENRSDKDVSNITQDIIRASVIALRTSGRNLPNVESDNNVGTFFQGTLVENKRFYQLFVKVLFNFGLKEALQVLKCRLKFNHGNRFLLSSYIFLSSGKCEIPENENFKLFSNNPLVLVHDGEGTSDQLIDFINVIRGSVFKKTGILIAIEPELVGLEFNTKWE